MPQNTKIIANLTHLQGSVKCGFRYGNVLDLVSVKGKGYLKKVSHNFI